MYASDSAQTSFYEHLLQLRAQHHFHDEKCLLDAPDSRVQAWQRTNAFVPCDDANV